MEKQSKFLTIYHIVITIVLVLSAIILQWGDIYTFIFAWIIFGAFFLFLTYHAVREKIAMGKKKMPKMARVFMFISIGFVVVFFAVNIFLPKAKENEDGTYSFKGKTYDVYLTNDNGWKPAAMSMVAGNVAPQTLELLYSSLGLGRLHAAKGDTNHIFYYASDTMSEFGDYILYDTEYEFPAIETLTPYKAVVADYGFYKKYQVLFSSAYAITENAELVNKIYECVLNQTTYKETFFSYDLSEIKGLKDDFFYIGIYFEEIPGCVYTVSVKKEGDNYFANFGEDNVIDITSMIFEILE